ncbi:hypothetical protein IR009_05055 [Pseudomonas putida]|uniref:hypothetical protein n=1 Tax=Pseudomonas putida TaxID=303 RepID=UPI0018AAE732|nr:hypothetical protein [Pseudomonas putida]MBF8764585.1 hypothetical protein [Pseudomonas putida]
MDASVFVGPAGEQNQQYPLAGGLEAANFQGQRPVRDCQPLLEVQGHTRTRHLGEMWEPLVHFVGDGLPCGQTYLFKMEGVAGTSRVVHQVAIVIELAVLILEHLQDAQAFIDLLDDGVIGSSFQAQLLVLGLELKQPGL